MNEPTSTVTPELETTVGVNDNVQVGENQTTSPQLRSYVEANKQAMNLMMKNLMLEREEDRKELSALRLAVEKSLCNVQGGENQTMNPDMLRYLETNMPEFKLMLDEWKTKKPSPDQSPSNGLNRRFFLSEESDRYDVEKKGLVAIINNFTDSEDELYRKGTIEDERRIREFFNRREFREKYELHKKLHNKDKEKFEQALDELVEVLKSSAYDKFFLFILSHGDKGAVTAYHKCQGGNMEGRKEGSEEGREKSNSEPSVDIHDEIISKFESSIEGCPKVIVIQACQGRAHNSQPDSDITQISQPDDGGDSLAETYIELVTPKAADMLVAYASVKGYCAYRWKNYNPGAWFIQELIKQLEEAHKDTYYSSHLASILTKVQLEVSKLDDSCEIKDKKTKEIRLYKIKQMPCFLSSLRKKFYLIPPTLPSAGQL